MKQELEALQDPGLIHMSWQKFKWQTRVLAEGPSVADCRLQAEGRVRVAEAWLAVWGPLPFFAHVVSHVFWNNHVFIRGGLCNETEQVFETLSLSCSSQWRSCSDLLDVANV